MFHIKQAMQLLIKAKIMDLRGVFWKKFIEICERYEMGKKEIIFFWFLCNRKRKKRWWKRCDIDLTIVTNQDKKQIKEGIEIDFMLNQEEF